MSEEVGSIEKCKNKYAGTITIEEIHCPSPDKFEEMSVIELFTPSAMLLTPKDLKAPGNYFRFPEDLHATWENCSSPAYIERGDVSINGSSSKAHDLERLGRPRKSTGQYSPISKAYSLPNYSPSHQFQYYEF